MPQLFVRRSSSGQPPHVCRKCSNGRNLIPHFVSLEEQRHALYFVTGSKKKETVNQRQHNRYRLAVLVAFSWETEDHHVRHGNGQTRDCSLSGAFIVSPDKLSIGSILQMEFSLPRLLAAGPGARLKTRGRVVRVESEGFAVLAEIGPSSLLLRPVGPGAATHAGASAK